MQGLLIAVMVAWTLERALVALGFAIMRRPESLREFADRCGCTEAEARRRLWGVAPWQAVKAALCIGAWVWLCRCGAFDGVFGE